MLWNVLFSLARFQMNYWKKELAICAVLYWKTYGVYYNWYIYYHIIVIGDDDVYYELGIYETD